MASLSSSRVCAPTAPRGADARMLTAGGSGVPRSLMEAHQGALRRDHGPGWGMNETSPLCALPFAPKGDNSGSE